MFTLLTNLQLGQDLAGSACLCYTKHRVEWLDIVGWNHWKVLVVGWDLSHGCWTECLHVTSPRSLSVLTT